MFANCQKGGTNMAAPDVCKTPVGPSVVPIPYPNIALGATANPGTAAKKVLVSATPAHTLQTIVPMSNGDNAGVVGGVISGGMMGPRRHLMGATNVLMGGMPATKLTDQTGQNGSSLNCSGATIAPAQTTVMIMSGGSGGAGGSASPTSSSSPQEKSTEEKKPAVVNPKWEHVDEETKKEIPDVALPGDIVKLKVEVQEIPSGATVIFKIYDASTGKRLDTILGEVASGAAFVEWRVRTPRGSKGKPSLEFEARVRGLTSARVKIPVGSEFRFSV